MTPRLRAVLIVALVALLWLLNVAVASANFAWDFGVVPFRISGLT
jgi:hypothetical protein